MAKFVVYLEPLIVEAVDASEANTGTVKRLLRGEIGLDVLEVEASAKSPKRYADLREIVTFDVAASPTPVREAAEPAVPAEPVP